MNVRQRKMQTRLKKMQILALELVELGYSFSEKDTQIVLIDDLKEVHTTKQGSVSYGFIGGFEDDTEIIGTLYN